MGKTMKRTLSLLLCAAFTVMLLPMTALAEAATPQWLVITEDAAGLSCVYKDLYVSGEANGVLITGGDVAYELGSGDGLNTIIVQDAAVNYSGTSEDIYVLGTGSVITSNYTITKGTSEENKYVGVNGGELLGFIGGIAEGYANSYTFTRNYSLNQTLIAYDVTVNPDTTLTLQNRLNIVNSLTVNGTLTANEGQELEIGENATVSGMTLYNDDDTTYILAEEHLSESFTYTGGKWVHNNPGVPPELQFSVRFRDNEVNVTYSLNGAAAVTAVDGNWVDYPESGNVVLTFTAQLGQNFYGISVREGETTTYIKADSLTSNTYTIPDFDNSIEIEAITWITPFDNEYMVEYDGDSGEMVSVDGSQRDARVVYPCSSGAGLQFALTPPENVTAPYKVEMQVNGTQDAIDLTSDFSDNTHIYTTTGAGFTLRIYWTQEEYNYQALQPNEGYFMVEYRWSGNGTVTHNTVTYPNYATYGTSTRVVIANEVNSIDLTYTPTPGGEPANVVTEMRLDNVAVDFTVGGGIYSMNVTDHNWHNLEVRFTDGGGGDPGDPGDPSAQYTITATAGVNGSIDPSGDVTVNDGEDRRFVITPDSGYVIDGIEVDEVSLEESFGTGDWSYYFYNIQDDHSIAATFAEYVPNPVTGNPKSIINFNEYAYSGNQTAVMEAFVDELWLSVFVGNTASAINTKTELTAEVSFDSLTNTDSEILNKSYYPFTIDLDKDNGLDDADDATGRVYVLGDAREFLVRTTVGEAKTYTLVTSVENPSSPYTVVADFDSGAENKVYVFGNGTLMAGLGTSGNGLVAGHVITPIGWTHTQINCQLVVYKPSFEGVKIVAQGDSGYAAAWGFAQFPVVGVGGTTQTDPTEVEVFFGNTSTAISKIELGGVIGIAGITDITSTLPTGAVTIESSGLAPNKTFTVTFNSNFYDEVPLAITYSTSGGSKTGYVLLRRVGIEIVGYQYHPEEGPGSVNLNTNHGTDPGYNEDDYWSVTNNYAVFATYYYPTGATGSIDLYATYTWADGSVTTALLTNSQRKAHTNADANTVAMDDFELYKGPEASSPTKIEITAVNSGTTNDRFAGATLGSGAGVEWEYTQR